MKKIIHLSDIHLGHNNCAEKFNTLINKIITIKQPSSDYIILITGDIVEDATKEDLVQQSKQFLNQLEKHGFKLLIIPGNHDYGSGSWASEKYVDIFKERYYGTTQIEYPKLDIIDNEIAFIGLDSTAEELHWYDRGLAEGELGEEQLNRLKEMLKKPEIQNLKKVIYLHHHPFGFRIGMQLKDKDKLQQVVENKVDAILFGHFHDDAESAGKDFNGRWGIRRCYNAGSSTFKNGNPGKHRVIDLSTDDTTADFNGNFFDL